MSDEKDVKIMITVQWNDDSYHQMRIGKDAVTTIEIVADPALLRTRHMEVILQAALKQTVDEWMKKEKIQCVPNT